MRLMDRGPVIDEEWEPGLRVDCAVLPVCCIRTVLKARTNHLWARTRPAEGSLLVCVDAECMRPIIYRRGEWVRGGHRA